MPGSESGLILYGQQRGAAVCDFDQDGRADLAVGQNGDETKLYRNVTAKPGLRVRLAGPPGNPDGIGALLRIGDGTRFGPAREIHAGSGWLSQDSAIQVLASPGNKISVRWPGGRSTEAALPPGAREVRLDLGGKLSVLR